MFIFALVAVAQQCRYKSYKSIMLEDHNYEKFIPAPIAFECRVSRLGNSYEAAVSHPILRNKLNEVNIIFSDKIDISLHAKLFQIIRDCMPQRINHEVLWKILLREEFAIRIGLRPGDGQ